MVPVFFSYLHLYIITLYRKSGTNKIYLEEKEMFKNKRCMTRGVQQQIPNYLQNMMWHMIDTMQTETKDYIQVFHLSQQAQNQKILHKQEIPPFSQELLVDSKDFSIVTQKVYVIDDETHTTMLLSEEY